MTISTSQDDLTLYRIERFAEMGFSDDDAVLLAESRGSDEWLISTHKVERMIAQGCPLNLVLLIVM